MASNDPWPPVTSSSSIKGQSRGKNNTNRKKDHQQMVLDLVTEMFASTLEKEVIFSLAQNCNWELQSTIDALIALSATVDTTINQINENSNCSSSMSNIERDPYHITNDEVSNDFLKMDQVELKQQLEGLNKFEHMKINSRKNRMDCFRDNIFKLDISNDGIQRDIEKKIIPCSPWNSVNNPNKTDKTEVWQNNDVTFSSDLFMQNYQIASNQLLNSPVDSTHNVCQIGSIPSITSTKKKSLNQNKISKNLNKSLNTRQLGGLQVHYRSPGTESSSDDEDADVIIEEEFNDCSIPTEIPINVSQFLSSTVQTSSSSSQCYKTQMRTTASPPSSPHRSVYEMTLNRIKATIQRGDKILIILRGLPGSGKSTLAKSLVTITGCKGDPSLYIFGTDDYFLNKRAVYTFDPMKLGDAHSANHRRVNDALKSSRSPIIIDNTNLQAWEMRPYATMAVQHGYSIEVLDVNTPWANNIKELAKKNLHGVPKKSIEKMKDRYERGISGQKLLQLFSLKYSGEKNSEKIETINKTNVLTAEDMAVLQNINQIPNKVKKENEDSFKHKSNNGDNDNNILLNYLRELTSDEMKEKNEQENVTTNNTEVTSDKNKEILSDNKDDNHLLQPLGAIGSERKNSVVHPEIINSPREINLDSGGESNDNVLSQCWDFTISLNGKTFHSDHRDDHYYFRSSQESPMNADQMRKQDEEFGKEEQCVTVRPSLLKTPINNLSHMDETKLEYSGLNEFFKTLNLEYSAAIDNFEQRKSTVIITEITEDFSNSEDALEIEKIYKHTRAHCSKLSQINSITNTVQYEEIPIKYLASIEAPKDKDINDFNMPSNVEPMKIESLESNETKNSNFIYIKDKQNISEMIVHKDAHESWTNSNFGTFFDILRASLYGSDNIQGIIPEIKDDKVHIDKIQIATFEKFEEEFDTEESNEIKCQEMPFNQPGQVADIAAVGDVKQENHNAKTIDKFTTNDNINIQYEQLEKLNDKINSSMKRNVEPCEKLDNVDGIPWMESLFSVDDISVEKLNSNLNIIPESVLKMEASTNTTNYDFNIAYIGGTSEPGHRVINASSRDIHNDLPMMNLERPSLKVMLDKSSMTAEPIDIESLESNEIKDLNFINVDDKQEISEMIVNEETHESWTKSNFGTFFNILRASLYRSDNIQEIMPEIKDDKVYIDNIQKSTFKKHEEEFDNEESNGIECQDMLLNQQGQVTDIGAIGNINHENYNDKSIDKLTTNDNINNQCEQLEKLNDEEDSSMKLNVGSCEKLNNVDRITWMESLFPLDDISVEKLNSDLNIIPESVLKTDASTNTTYYDFNVAYIGGTSEPGYRVMNASGRRVHNDSPVMNSERPPSKLMLDKSSMTSDIYNIESNLDSKKYDNNINRISELIELFPRIPREYLIEIYEKCIHNFDWTVDVLLDGVPDDVTIKVPNETDMIDCEVSSISLHESNEPIECSLESAQQTNYSTKIDSINIEPVMNENKLQYQSSCQDENQKEKLQINKNYLFYVDYINDLKTDISDNTSIAYDNISPDITEVSDTPQELTENDKSPEPEETIELNLGCEFIHTLENQFGNPDFQIPDGFQSVITIKKSLAEELHALWIESMYQQLNVRHEQLDKMIAEDAEYAKSLEREMELEEAQGSSSIQCEPTVPNLNEIMDMELALASYKNELKSMVVNEIPDDMASRLSRQMLHESLPDMDPETFNEILKAHNGNFKETFEIIESNIGRSITPCDTPKKSSCSNLSKRTKEENIITNDDIVRSKSNINIRSDNKCNEKSPYKSALTKIANSRKEAQRQFSLRVDHFNKAAEAYRRGYPQVAAYYSQVARLHSKNIEAAQSDVVSALVQEQIYGDSDNTLDLHYLCVTEALQALDEFLDHHLNKLTKSKTKKSSILYIITGRGARSSNGTSKIKPAISKALLTRNIRFTEVNAGCLKINLYRKKGVSD